MNLEPVMEVSERVSVFSFLLSLFPFFGGRCTHCRRRKYEMEQATGGGRKGEEREAKTKLTPILQGHGLETLIRALAADHEERLLEEMEEEVVGGAA